MSNIHLSIYPESKQDVIKGVLESAEDVVGYLKKWFGASEVIVK